MDWRTTLGYAPGNTYQNLQKKYKKLAIKYHPDKGGSTAQFQKLKGALNRAHEVIVEGKPETPRGYNTSPFSWSPPPTPGPFDSWKPTSTPAGVSPRRTSSGKKARRGGKVLGRKARRELQRRHAEKHHGATYSTPLRETHRRGPSYHGGATAMDWSR